MVKALGIGFAMLLGYALLHTLPMQWILTVLILSGCVTLALLDPPQSDPRRWLPEEHDHGYAKDDPKAVCCECGAIGCYYHESPWTLDDERAMAADRDYDEERSE